MKARDAIYEVLSDREPHTYEELLEAHPEWRIGLRKLAEWGIIFSVNKTRDKIRIVPISWDYQENPVSRKMADLFIAHAEEFIGAEDGDSSDLDEEEAFEDMPLSDVLSGDDLDAYQRYERRPRNLFSVGRKGESVERNEEVDLKAGAASGEEAVGKEADSDEEVVDDSEDDAAEDDAAENDAAEDEAAEDENAENEDVEDDEAAEDETVDAEDDSPSPGIVSAKESSHAPKRLATTGTLRVSETLTFSERFVADTFAILARKGQGKSYTAMVIAEEMFAVGWPFVVLDPTGAWWGLRVGANGQARDGLPILIAGGPHGDVPITVGQGGAAAQFAMTHYPVSLVVDFTDMTPEDMKTFGRDFFRTLYMGNRRAIHVFVDEADEFAPQAPQTAAENEVLKEVDRIVRRGRIRGVGSTMITQRPAVIAKNVLSQVESLLILRLSAPQDQKAIENWVKSTLEKSQIERLLTSLKSIARGTLWHLADGRTSRHKVRRKRTWDSSRTPKIGEEIRHPDLDPVPLAAELSAYLREHDKTKPQGQGESQDENQGENQNEDRV